MAIQMQRTTVVSAHIEREARKLLANRDRWVYARNAQTGVAFVAIPSPCRDPRCPKAANTHEHVRHVRPDGRGCDCVATQRWETPTCKHRQAVLLANAEQEQAEQPAPFSWADLRAEMPSCAGGCGSLLDSSRLTLCDDCSAARARSEKLAAARRRVAEEWMAS